MQKHTLTHTLTGSNLEKDKRKRREGDAEKAGESTEGREINQAEMHRTKTEQIINNTEKTLYHCAVQTFTKKQPKKPEHPAAVGVCAFKTHDTGRN